jgi:hypothetical protein
MPSIEKRGDVYRIRVSCGYDTAGKQIMKRTTWKPPAGMTDKQIEKELNRFAIDFENKVLNGNSADTTNIKLADFCVQYLEIADNILAPATKQFYIRIIDKIIIPALGHLKLKDIKPIHVQRFIQMLGGEGVRIDNKGDKLSPATINGTGV